MYAHRWEWFWIPLKIQHRKYYIILCNLGDLGQTHFVIYFRFTQAHNNIQFRHLIDPYDICSYVQKINHDPSTNLNESSVSDLILVSFHIMHFPCISNKRFQDTGSPCLYLFTTMYHEDIFPFTCNLLFISVVNVSTKWINDSQTFKKEILLLRKTSMILNWMPFEIHYN